MRIDDELGEDAGAENGAVRERLAKLMIAADRKRERKSVAVSPRGESQEPLPLSFAQSRLWFLEQTGLIGTAYNMQLAVRLTGWLQPHVLERCFSELVRRHEILRTRFIDRDGVPYQVVTPPAPFRLSQYSLMHISDVAVREQQLDEFLRRERMHRFELDSDSLWRVITLEMGLKEHVLVLTKHHIISDGWSLGLMLDELSSLYPPYARHGDSPLAPLPVQYADYAIWQRRLMDDRALAPHLQYWRDRLAGAPPQLQLPTDRPRPIVESFRGGDVRFKISEASSEALKDLAKGEGATLFMVAMAAFSVLLSRWSGQHDIVLGTPVAGRKQKELQALIGFFVNMLPLRIDASPSLTFRELLRRVIDLTLDAYDHQDVPFETLVQKLRPDRDLARQPIFQVVLAVEDSPAERLKLPELSLTWLEPERTTTHFDLTLYMSAQSDGLSCAFEYAADLFDRSSIEELVDNLRATLDGIVDNADCPIRQLPMLTERQKHQVLVNWNATEAPYQNHRCLHELVSEQVRRTPDAVAVVLDNSSLSYAQLDASAEVLARRIARSARASDAIIGVLLPRSADMIISYLAVLKAGCGYLPLDPGLPEQRIRMMLEDGCASVLVTSAACAERLDSHVGLRLLLLDEPRPSAAEIMELPVVSPDNIAYVIYTSGSTGRPKGVLVPHRGLCNLIAWHHDQLGLRAGMRTSQVASVMFDAAAWEIWAALTVGATLVICSNVAELSSDELAEWLRRNEVNSTFLPTPLAEQLMLAQQNKPLSSLRLLLTGGDQLRQRPTPALPYEVRNNYGPTEITVVATSAVIDGQSSVPPIGKPIANTKTYLLDEWLQPVPVGVRGEIYIAGVGLARGYANQPTLTAERFVPDPFGLPGTRMYRTGDLARWRSDGNLEFVGRSDKQVKIRGYRIELAEVESVLLGHYAVKEAVVLARESANGDKRLVAYVTMRAGRGVEMEVLRRHLKDILPIYMVPAAFVYLESLPLTRNGKVDRESLPTPECEHVSTSYVPAVGEVEETLASVWSELLQVSQVGRFDNFFELGGHSLHGVKLAAIVSRRFGISMPLVTIFKCPTIHEIAGVITRLVNVGGKHPLDTSALEEGAI